MRVPGCGGVVAARQRSTTAAIAGVRATHVAQHTLKGIIAGHASYRELGIHEIGDDVHIQWT
eukprot:773796-Lingulodinium_polyedra.AAC.1